MECSDLGNSLGQGVEYRSELRDRPGLAVRQCSQLGDSLGEQVPLRHLPREQVRFGLAPEHWPAEHFGQLGQPSVLQPLQYSTDTNVVR